MKTITKSIAILVATTIVSCGPSGDSPSSVNNVNSDIDPKAEGGNTCLLGYADKYDELLTKEMVSTATGIKTNEMDQETNQYTKNSKYHDVTYSWKTGRIKNIHGMDIPVDDYIKLTGIESISLDRFKMSYRAVTQKEAEALSVKTNEALDGKSDNEAVNKRLKKLDEMGVSKEDQKKMMDGLAGSAQKMTEGFSAVEDLGDAATWNSKTQTLYVLQNGAMFELVVDLSDLRKNKEIASKIARMILDKCK